MQFCGLSALRPFHVTHRSSARLSKIMVMRSNLWSSTKLFEQQWQRKRVRLASHGLKLITTSEHLAATAQ